MILGNSTKRAEEFASHQACRLGKWYYEGKGHHCFSHFPGFRELEAPHRAVHEAAKAALAAHTQGQWDQAVTALTQMEEASLQVLTTLDRIVAAGEENPALLHCETD
ncbi:CZB domain-containing protein [Hydrogenophilus thiooxidans]|uniref:CZB domain-containing protein n=1 Tax=Hydrogenophilus thiooxidans TaxID=2820326 RepID=UPI003D2CB808